MFRASNLADDIVLFEMIDRQSDADGQAYLAALDDLAARSDPVILIFLVSGFVDQDHEIRKQAAIWFKHNRDRLGHFAKGLIRVDEGHHHGDGNVHSHGGDNPEHSNFARMLPFPVRHVVTRDDAFALARDWPSVSAD